MTRTEINGFDETGTIGNDLRFVRVGMDSALRLRPFVYNILHFGSVTVSKAMLRGIEDDKKKNYVRMTLMDPSIDVDQYVFSSDHQLDILRQFTLLESKSLFSLRGIAVRALQRSSPELSIEEALSEISNYLRRYEKSPFWMESFVKSYGFRMVVSDLCKSSRVMKKMGQEDVRIISQVDGGFPFVFWWRSLLSETCTNHIHFSLEKTPIYGITALLQNQSDRARPVIAS